MVVPSTADVFRAAVSALRSLDEREVVSFHTFKLPGDSCVRLLVKNLVGVSLKASSGRSWNPLTFVSRKSHSCVLPVATRTPPRTAHPPPLHCISVARS